MEKATGIGGLFFRARDPETLGRWYQTHLGITFDGYVWHQEAGPTVLRPFPEDTDYFPSDRAWMLNLRVNDLDAMIAQLKDAGIAVSTDPDWDDPQIGRFARIHDPEGTPIELWEPVRQR